MPDHSAPPTQDDLYELAVDETRAALQGAGAQYDQYHFHPGHWPHLAATLDHLGRRLTAHAAELSAALAAYAQAHPSIEVPDEPGVLLLTARQHHEFWADARERACQVEQRAGAIPTAGQYGEAVAAEYGRPDLDHRVVLLDSDNEDGAVMVVFSATEQGPDAVVQVWIGGKDTTNPADHEQIEAALAAQSITPGRPHFWPPLHAESTFISLGHPEVFYDAYGRAIR